MSPSLRPRAALVRALLAAAALLVLAAPRAQAVAGSPYSGTGFDVSYPQCSSYRGVTGAFGIVGVNGGRPFTDNSCFDAEYDAAQPVSIYMNLKAPVGRTGPVYTSGPRSCGSDKLCQAHNYGWNAADHAYKAALPRTAATWWLDIETANSWTGKTAINVATIQGAVDYFRRQPTLGVQAVGIYSTPAMWRTITGGHRDPTWPVWVPGADKGSCGTGFTTGPVWLVQTASGVSNGDLAC
jgi:hypothetical protein